MSAAEGPRRDAPATPAGERGPAHDEPNTFSGANLDRAATRRADDAWLAGLVADPESRAVAVVPDGILVTPGDPPRPVRVPLAPFAGGAGIPPLLLGIEHGRALFAVDGGTGGDEGAGAEADDAVAADRDGPAGVRSVVEASAPGARTIGLREAGALLTQADGGLVAYASALVNWHRRHRHCAVCGTRTEVAEAGHVRRCPRCGATHHPRTDPVVIMLVTDGDRALLGRQPSWPVGRYSALAGFVEPGETLEEAVVREVSEEAGVLAADPRYVSSQPWPFPSSLMLGFTATYAGGEAAVRDRELEDVRWFTRAELRRAAGGSEGWGSADAGWIGLPPRLAIARRLIDAWLAAG